MCVTTLNPLVSPNGSCIDHYTSDYTYKRYFKTSKSEIQFFITEKKYNYRKKNVFNDENEYLKQRFFKYALNCGNYIIIKPNGDYLIRLGEYRQDLVYEKIHFNKNKL